MRTAAAAKPSSAAVKCGSSSVSTSPRRDWSARPTATMASIPASRTSGKGSRRSPTSGDTAAGSPILPSAVAAAARTWPMPSASRVSSSGTASRQPPAPEHPGQAQAHDGRRVEQAGDQQGQIGVREPVEHPREQLLVLLRGLRQRVEQDRHHPRPRRETQQRRGGGARLRVFLAEQTRAETRRNRRRPARARPRRAPPRRRPCPRRGRMRCTASAATRRRPRSREKSASSRCGTACVVPDPAERLQRGLAQAGLAEQRRDGGGGRGVADLAERPQARRRSASRRLRRGDAAAPGPRPCRAGGRGTRRRRRRRSPRGPRAPRAAAPAPPGPRCCRGRRRRICAGRGPGPRPGAPAPAPRPGRGAPGPPSNCCAGRRCPRPAAPRSAAAGSSAAGASSTQIQGGLAHPPAGVAERPDQARERLRPGVAQPLDRRVADLVVRGGELLAQLLGSGHAVPAAGPGRRRARPCAWR